MVRPRSLSRSSESEALSKCGDPIVCSAFGRSLTSNILLILPSNQRTSEISSSRSGSFVSSGRIAKPFRMLALIVCALTVMPAHAHHPGSKDVAESLSTLRIPHLTREPKIEDFANMEPSPAVRDSMLKIDQFLQRDPKDGVPISQRTEAYLGYTDKMLYLVFLAFDTQMSEIRNHMVRREQINEEDQVGVFLDTFHDRRHAVFFFINPAGVQQEGTYLEGQDIDLSWDTIWHSDTRIYPQGWVGFIAVPFKSLRFKSTDDVQSWGFLLERDIPHN